ncbi:beta-lactamase family protein [Virgibacillus sp. MSP4-1]|uniref:serine hydrolase domain-containing protein n=1 Tax=Virgibacillus sp. MSP4-1 TaxID=2700081 RepID=UPI00039DCB52|nr:serine hydrolase domain-containing protein [Virgibacillus sp. MSP4-1]QHS24066.1 beta-lactamase family protein [Virgibacillus sp. MSP4-1]
MWSLFEKRLIERMEKEHHVGTAVGVLKKGVVIYQRGFGVLDLQSRSPVTSNSLFGTASISKSFAALAIMILEEQGLLSVHDPVVKYVPGFKLKRISNMRKIKIHHLLSHTSGLAPVKRDENRNRFKDEKNFLMRGDHSILGDPGQYFSYSNDMFSLLGEIIEKTSGKLFRRFITEEILRPLEMNRTTLSIEEIHKMNQVSTPYTYNKEKRAHRKEAWPPLGIYEVGGGVRSTVLDLLEYGDLFLNHGKIGDEELLSPAAVKRMYQPYAKISQNKYYGYALNVTSDYHGYTLVEHGGSQPGVSSHFGFVPEEDLVVVVLSNVSDLPAGDIWLEAVNTALGIPMEEKDEGFPESSLSEAQWQRLMGTYSSDEGHWLEVKIVNHQPLIHINGEDHSVYPSDEKTLVIKGSNIPVHFYITDHRCWAAFFGMRMLLKE